MFRIKHDEHNSNLRFKAKAVVKGFSQKKGIDLYEIFSLVVKMTSICTMLGLAASLDLEIEQMDVKTTFFHGDLEEEIYMEEPEGFKEKGKKDYVCKLKKSLYSLKQALIQWYKKFESIIKATRRLLHIIVCLCINSPIMISLFSYSIWMIC